MEFSTSNRRVHTLQSRLKDVTNEILRYETIIEDLKRKLNNEKHQSSSKQNKSNKLNKNNEALLKDIASLENELEESKEQLFCKDKSCKKLIEKNKEQQESIKQLEKSLKNKESTLYNLEETLGIFSGIKPILNEKTKNEIILGLETIKNQKDSKNEEPNQIATTLKETSINLQKCLLNLNNAFTKTKDCNNLNETKVSINNLFVELQDTYHNKTYLPPVNEQKQESYSFNVILKICLIAMIVFIMKS